MSQFNFIYAEEHLSHREKAVYIYLRDRADASGGCWPGTTPGRKPTPYKCGICLAQTATI